MSAMPERTPQQASRARGVRRTALIAGAIALALYLAFIGAGAYFSGASA